MSFRSNLTKIFRRFENHSENQKVFKVLEQTWRQIYQLEAAKNNKKQHPIDTQ